MEAPAQVPAPPQDFLCPITRELMVDPVVVVETGQSYERSALLHWWSGGNYSCPTTGVRLRSLMISQNYALKAAIHSWLQACGSAAGNGDSKGSNDSQATAEQGAPCPATVPVPAPFGSASSPTFAASGLLASVGHGNNRSGWLKQAGSSTLASSSSCPTARMPGAGPVRVQSHPLCLEMEGLSLDASAAAAGPRRSNSGCGDVAMGEAGSPPPEVSASVQGDATAGAGAQPQGIPSSPRLPQAGERITGERTASTGVPRAPPPGVALLSGSQHPDAPPAGWTFFPGLDSPGGDICQAADLTAAGSTPAASPAAGSSLATGSAFAQALARVGPGGSQTTLRPMSGASCVAAVAGAATGVVLGTAADVAGLLRRARPASPPGSPAQQQQQQQQSHGMLHALIGLLPYVGGGGSNQASSSTTAITAPGNPSVPSPAAVAAAAAAVGPSGPNPLLMHMPMGVVPAGLPQGAEALAALVAEQRLQGLGAFPTAPLVFPPGFLEVSSLAPSASGALATLPGIGRRLPEGVVPAGPGPAHASTAGGNSSGQGEWWLSNVVAYNTNGWLKALLQPMHAWVKWTAEAGKGLFVRNDVLLALVQGVLAHVQGNQCAPVQLAGWTFCQGLDCVGGDVAWAWQHAGSPGRLAMVAQELDAGIIAFNTDGYMKSSLAPCHEWVRVEMWADKPGSGMYVHNSILWKLMLA